MNNPCGACGAVDLLDGAKFCRECGAEIPPPPEPAEERSSLTDDSRCADCDGLLVRDALYCHRCGADLTGDGEHPELAEAPTAGDGPDVLSASAAATSERDDPPASPDKPPPAVPADIGSGTGITMIALSAKYASTVSDATTFISKQPDPQRAAEPQAAPAPPQKTCSKCGAAATETAKFCRSCGSALDAAKEPSPGAVECASCGAHVQSSAAFCRHCGTPVAARATPAPPVLDASRCTICGAHDTGPNGLCAQCATTMAT